MDELLDQLLAANPEPKAFAAALKGKAPRLHAAVFAEGRAAGKADVQADLDAKTQEVETLTAERDQVKKDLKAAQDKAPDADSIRDQAQKDLDAAKAAHERQTKALNQQLADMRTRQARSELATRLESILDPAVRETYLENAMARLEWDDKGRMFAKGKGGTPRLSEDATADHLQLLADDVLTSVPAGLKSTTVQAGTGSPGAVGDVPGGTNGGSPGSLDARYKAAAEAGKASVAPTADLAKRAFN